MKFFFDTDEMLKAEETENGMFLSGVASTTGIDKQFEVMSANALKSMVETTSIIPIVTSHNAEAKDVIGEVTAHSIDAEGRYVIKAELDRNDPDAVRLFKQVQKGHRIGFSVGGRILSAKPGVNKSVKRVIDKVELDHIMITRRPVNPETFATALTKALSAYPEDTNNVDELELEDAIKADLSKALDTPVVVEDTLEKAGAMLSADNKTKLKSIHDIGDDKVKQSIREMFGVEADELLGPMPMISDGDDDDSKDAGAHVDNVVAGKSESDPAFDVVKSFADLKTELINEMKTELAKATKVEPKGATETGSLNLEKATTLDLQSLVAESIRKSISG
jgi:phage head maturation protease